jgi:7-cyano-7-deazaguanine synthase
MTAVVVYSGGMDSFTVLHDAIAKFGSAHAVSFNYGKVFPTTLLTLGISIL